jgi:hypothetical protein
VRFRAFAAVAWLVSTALCGGCFVYGESLLEATGAGGSGGGATTTTSTTSTSMGQPCAAAEDCPDPGSLCKTRVCVDQVCATENLAPNTEVMDPMPGDCQALVCDSAGGTIQVESSADIFDDDESCTVDACELGEPVHKPKIGFACGPTSMDVCNDQGDCVECIADADCTSDVCKDFACAPASCNDMTKNGTETDLDCGGACQDCATGKACKLDTDCKSGVCQSLVCQPSCTDGLKNSGETDVDCGGAMCGKCADGETCAAPGDCLSAICTANKCAVPTCMDGVKNGMETAIDCGGPSCLSCPLDHLVINEVDYDQLSTDTLEFVEIYNATLSTVSLAGIKLVLVDGNANVPYASIDLSSAGSLAAGEYLVIGAAAVAAGGAKKIDFAGASNQLQNGPPDGLALIDDTADVLIDALSYEGAITTADLSLYGLGTVSLVEGAALAANVDDDAGGSLCRIPSAKDTNSAAADWALSMTPTPGGPNVP